MQTVLKNALGALLIMSGSQALAVDHEIRMERYGYFPKTIYVQAGDTITFVNNTPNWAQIYSADSNDNNSNYDWNNPCAWMDNSSANKGYNGDGDGWSIGWFSKGSSRTINVTSCMETTIYPPNIYQYSYDDNKYRAEIVYGSPPPQS